MVLHSYRQKGLQSPKLGSPLPRTSIKLHLGSVLTTHVPDHSAQNCEIGRTICSYSASSGFYSKKLHPQCGNPRHNFLSWESRNICVLDTCCDYQITGSILGRCSMPKIKQGHLARKKNKIWWGNRSCQGKFCCCNSGEEEEAVGQQRPSSKVTTNFSSLWQGPNF